MTRTAEQFHERMWDILDPVDTEYFEVVAAPARTRRRYTAWRPLSASAAAAAFAASVSAPTACA